MPRSAVPPDCKAYSMIIALNMANPPDGPAAGHLIPGSVEGAPPRSCITQKCTKGCWVREQCKTYAQCRGSGSPTAAASGMPCSSTRASCTTVAGGWIADQADQLVRGT